MQNFHKANWHGLTGPEGKSGDYGLSFRMGDGTLIRLRLNRAQAEAVRDGLNLATGMVAPVQTQNAGVTYDHRN